MSAEEMARNTVMAYAPDYGHREIVDVKTVGKVAAVHYRTESRDGFIEIVYLAWGSSISELAEITRGKGLTLGEIKDEGEYFTVSINNEPWQRRKLGMRLWNDR